MRARSRAVSWAIGGGNDAPPAHFSDGARGPRGGHGLDRARLLLGPRRLEARRRVRVPVAHGRGESLPRRALRRSLPPRGPVADAGPRRTPEAGLGPPVPRAVLWTD